MEGNTVRARKHVETAGHLVTKALNPHRHQQALHAIQNNDIMRSLVQRVRDGLLSSTGEAHNNLTLEKWLAKYIVLDDPAPPNEMHKALSCRLQDFHRKRGQRMVVLAPRGYAKTTWVTFGYVLEAALTGREKYILIIGNDNDSAKAFVAALRQECENNLQLREDYPFLQVPQTKASFHEWSKFRLHLGNGVLIEARGAGKIRGRKHGQSRPSLVVVDDPSDDDHKTSAAKRSKLSHWFKATLLKIGNKNTNFVLAGTPIHRESLVMEVHGMKGWERLRFKAIQKEPARQDLWDKWKQVLLDPSNPASETEALAFYENNKGEMDKGAQVLWPERESLYFLQLMRVTEGRFQFEAEKQGNPIDPSSCEWPSAFEQMDDLWFDAWPKNPVVAVGALDPSKGKSDRSGDFQAAIYLAFHEGFWYVDADIQKRPIPQMVEDYVHSCSMIPGLVCAVVESVQFQEVLVPECEEQAVLDKIDIPIEPIGTGGVNKAIRIRRLGPIINRRRFKFKRKSPGVQLLIEQLTDFPNGEHDDGPDALEMALRKAREIIGGSENAGRTENPY